MNQNVEFDRARQFHERRGAARRSRFGGGTPFWLAAGLCAAADLSKQELRTIGLSVTVQERILADFKARLRRQARRPARRATFPDAQTKILSGSNDYDCWETIGERLPAVIADQQDRADPDRLR